MEEIETIENRVVEKIVEIEIIETMTEEPDLQGKIYCAILNNKWVRYIIDVNSKFYVYLNIVLF